MMPGESHHQGNPARSSGAVIATVAAVFLLTAVLGLCSDGVYHDDDLTHFMMARWARWCPEYLLHLWGRPGLTVPLAGVSWIGDAATAWHLARLLSAVVTALTALLAARLAMRLGIKPAWLVVLMCGLQPLNLVLGATTLTENFTAFYLVAAVLLLAKGRPTIASAVFSIALLTRHEAAVFLPVWYLALLAGDFPIRRKIPAFLAAISAPVLHNILFRIVFEDWPVTMLFAPRGSSEYPPISLLGYLPQALEAVPPVLGGLAMIGALVMLRQGRALIPAFAGVYLAAHVAIKASGVYGSGGYGRFMVAVAPFVAILAVAGLNEVVARARRQLPCRWQWMAMAAVWAVGLLAFEIEQRAGRIGLHDPRVIWALRGVAVAAVMLSMLSAFAARGKLLLPGMTAAFLALTCAIQWAVLVRPMRFRDEQRQVYDMVAWLKARDLDQQPLFTTNPWATYFLDLVELPRAHKGPRLLASMPIGTVFVWDSLYSPSDYHHLPLTQFDDNPAYELLEVFPARGVRNQEMRVYRKIAPTPPPPSEDNPYPPNLMARRPPLSGIYYLKPNEH